MFPFALLLAAALAQTAAPAERPSLSKAVELLASPDRARRDEAVETLSAAPADEVGKLVEKQLRSSNEDARLASLEVIRRIGYTRARGTVARALRQDASHRIRREAAHVLTAIAPDQAVSDLRSAALLDGDERVQRAAIQDLGRLRTLEATTALVDVLEALEEDDDYLLDIVTRSLTMASGKAFGANVEAWRHYVSDEEDRLEREEEEGAATDEEEPLLPEDLPVPDEP